MMARFAINLKRGIPKIAQRIALLMVLGGALLFGNCSNGLPHSSDVTAKVTPAQATIAVGGMLELEGNASGFTVSPLLAWWVQESHDAGGDDCGYLKLPSESPCPFGYLLYESVTQFPSPATYYAPQAPGTYHVTFEASQFSSFDHLSKTATATITVTP
jgi:hypothetical protein